MSLESININPQEIQRSQNQPASSIRPKADFGDFLGGLSATTPFAIELTKQSTGNINAANVLNAAFTSFPGAASAFGGGGSGGAAPSWARAQYTGGGTPGGIPGLDMNYATNAGSPPVSGGQVVPGTNMTQFQLMDVMNQNNLQLIELQAIMQSNMQVWNTKSNILSADHRAKLSMIEKFTARG